MRISLSFDRCPRARQVAATLAEVLVGVSMMGILFTSLYGGMSSGFAVTQVARENLRATQIMLERVEGLRLYNWNQLVYSNWVPESFTNWYYPLTNRGESPGIMYVGYMTVTNANLSPAANYSSLMRAVEVKVEWTSAGVPRSRSMVTYVSRNGVQNYVYDN